MSYISVEASVDIDIDDYLDEFLEEAKDKDLIKELEERGYTVTATKAVGPKAITDTWKDEEIAKAYNEFSWEEWKQMISEFAQNKGKKIPAFVILE